VGHAGPGPRAPDHPYCHAVVQPLYTNNCNTVVVSADRDAWQFAVAHAADCHVAVGSVDADQHWFTARRHTVARRASLRNAAARPAPGLVTDCRAGNGGVS
jgi:hypothetical protein